MIFLKDTVKGIDIPIQRIQKYLFQELKTMWGVSDADWNCYGRVYRNKDETGKYYPEPYTGQQGVEYADPLYDDRVKCTSFFGESDTVTELDGGLFKSQVHLIFCLNLAKIKPNIEHRADSEVHQNVLTVLRSAALDTTSLTLQQWLDTVFREYTSDKVRKHAIFTDLQPAHCFRINFNVTYMPDGCMFDFASAKPLPPLPPIVAPAGFDYVFDFALN